MFTEHLPIERSQMSTEGKYSAKKWRFLRENEGARGSPFVTPFGFPMKTTIAPEGTIPETAYSPRKSGCG
jgi:hypothetical protein